MNSHYSPLSDDLYGPRKGGGDGLPPQGPPMPPPPPQQQQPRPQPQQQPSELQYLRHVVSQLANKIHSMEKGGGYAATSEDGGGAKNGCNWQTILLGVIAFLVFVLVCMGSKLLKRMSFTVSPGATPYI